MMLSKKEFIRFRKPLRYYFSYEGVALSPAEVRTHPAFAKQRTNSAGQGAAKGFGLRGSIFYIQAQYMFGIETDLFEEAKSICEQIS